MRDGRAERVGTPGLPDCRAISDVGQPEIVAVDRPVLLVSSGVALAAMLPETYSATIPWGSTAR
jgi:hypothetical protein